MSRRSSTRAPSAAAAGADPAHERRRRAEGLVALALVQVSFGLFPVLVKLAHAGGEGFPIRTIAAWRIVVGALAIGAVALLRHPREFLPGAADLARLALCALLGIVLNQVLALEGVARTSATQAGILFTLIPVFTYAVAVAARQERFLPRRALGIAVALAGAVLLVALRTVRGGTAPAPVLGSLLLVTNSLVYAVYLVLARGLLARLPTLVVIAWAFLLSLWAPPLLLLAGEGAPVWPLQEPEGYGPTTPVLGAFLLVLLVPTVVAYLMNTYALARVSASTTAAFIYLQPLVSAGTAMAFLAERPRPSAALAAGLLFAGLGLVLSGDRARRG